MDKSKEKGRLKSRLEKIKKIKDDQNQEWRRFKEK
jgi:hypothetical protein